jgi:hypothetical protein
MLQTSFLLRMDAVDEAYPALQMLSETGVTLAVLAFRTMADAVGEYRLQHIEIGSTHIEVLVGYKPCQMLAHRWAQMPTIPRRNHPGGKHAP